MSSIHAPAPVNEAQRARFDWRDVISFISRFGLAIMWLWSGTLKMMDPLTFRQSVSAYQLFNDQIGDLVALLLPPTEIVFGLMLLLGLFLRPVSIIQGLVMISFIAGISSAWARGLSIDCGCFGSNQSADPASLGWAIARDIVFLAAIAWTIWRPFKRWALHP